MGNVATKVKEVLREAQLSLDSTADRRMSGFTLPISFDFIQLQFGDAAKQVPSGQSVVIINPESQTAYKYCLASEDRDRLTSLLNLNRAARSVFPESSMAIDKITFFTFPLLNLPLLPEAARQQAKLFVQSVYEAINELHVTFKLAHLDLRLGNICFGTGTEYRVAKLIDLDRAALVDEPFWCSALCALHISCTKSRERIGH